MTFTVDSAVDAAKPQSEDVVGVTDSAAWVIDGATGYGIDQFSDSDRYYSDGAWYARRLDAHLHDLISDRDRRLHEVVRDAIARVREECLALREDGAPDGIEPPCAALTLVRWDDDWFEYYGLADCSLIIDRESTNAIHVRPVGPRPFDQRVVEQMRTHAEETKTPFLDRDPVATQMIRDHRALKNTIDGYWVADLDPTVAYNGTQGRIAVEEIDRAILFSDGVEPLVETYDAFESWLDVLRHGLDAGADAVIYRVREIEQSDPDATTYPRTKQSDDASLVILEHESSE